jgi:peptide deformylase
MANLAIIKEPNKILRQKSKEISEITPEISQLILDMAETMKKENGVGLAAPQVGQNVRLVLVSIDKGPLALINPKIVWKSFRKETEEEGCLSCPNAYILIKRPKIVYIKALTKDGKKKFFRAKGLFARVCQHEIDHLNGILIIDKLSKKKRKSLNY